MKDFNKDLDYISGKKFADEYSFYYSVDEDTKTDREDIISNTINGKKVIHIGFADHMSNIDRKIKNRTWFHNMLIDNADKCIGIDINSETVEYIKEKYNIEGLYVGDITSSGLDFICEDKWDYLILGEVLEHIDNPQKFLFDIKDNYGKYFDKMIITVPNAWYYMNFVNMLSHREMINPDHRFWFTPYTLMKVCSSAGFKVSKLEMVNNKVELDREIKLNYKGKIMKKIYDWIVAKKPLSRQTIVITIDVK